MSNLMKSLTVLLIALTVISSVIVISYFSSQNTISTEYDDYNQAIAQVRTEIWQDINSGKSGSATVAIMDNGKIVYSEGFAMADRENSIPVDTQTMFNIGSISKTFCAAAVMLLVDDGKVKLDDPVTKYIPDFVMADSRYTNITVKMLLDHTSGLPGTVFANNVGYEYNPTVYQEILSSLSQAHLKATPGEMAPYTNDGFSLAELLVVRVSGQSYMDFLSQRIFKPLSLDHTGNSVGEQSNKTIAAYYQSDTGKKVPPEVLSIIGAGGLSSTAEDLVRFADSFSKNGKQILSQSSIDEMIKAQPSSLAIHAQKEIGINPEICYGLGLDIAGLPYYQAKGIYLIGKGGDTADYHSMLLSAPEQRLSVAVIEAGYGSSAVKIAFNVFNAVLQQKGLIEKEDVPVSSPLVPENIPPQYTSFEGYYAPTYKASFDFDANVCVLTVLSSVEPIYALHYITATAISIAILVVDTASYLLMARTIL